MIPTKPGIYWRYGLNHNGELFEQVVKVGYLSPHSDDLFYWEHGRIGAIYIDADDAQGVEWEEVKRADFAHFWHCPTCGADVPSYLEFCFHDQRTQVTTNSEMA